MPKFKHDSDCCQFLGTLDDVDMYFCREDHATVIARFGDDGPDYVSGVMFAKLARVDGRMLVLVETTSGALKPGDQGPNDPTHRALRVALLIAKDCEML